MGTGLHFFTDCYWFGGSEMTMYVLWDACRNGGEPAHLTYRSSPEYDRGLQARLPDAIADPVVLPQPAAVRMAASRGIGRVARVLPLRQLLLPWHVLVLYRRFRRTRSDIVHINNGGFPAAVSCNAAVFSARLAGIKRVVYVVNNLAEPRDSWSRYLDAPIDFAVRNLVTTFVTGSEAAATALRGVLGTTTPVRVIPNTIIAGAADEAPQETRRRLRLHGASAVLLLVAVFEKRKGHRVLVEAMTRVDGVLAVFAGDGPERVSVQEFALELGVADRIRFVQNENVWNLFQAADIVALPSVANEDFPIVILEAMSVGKPVVASTVSGIPEQVVDGETGLLVPPGDVAALAGAIEQLLGDSDRRISMGASGQERFARCFSNEAVVARYRALYSELRERARPG